MEEEKQVKLKRLSCVLLSVLLAGSMLPATAFAAGPSKTQEDAINWVRSQVGQYLDFDSMYGAQCTDLIMYYYRFLGYDPFWGNGCDYASGDALRYGWSRLYQAQPQPGDILVYEAGPLNPSGHVAIYESDYVHYHQNVVGVGQSPGVVRATWYYNDPADYDYAKYWGVIRPAWSTGSDPSDDYGYRVTLDANGGTVSPSYIYVTDWYRNLPTPTRTGYTFYSWSVDKTSDFLSLVDNDWRVTKREDHTLYAIWEPCWYKVSFDACGGTASESKRNIAYNSTYGTLPTATRSGYRFQGWFTSASGGSQVTSGNIYSIAGNQTLYAHWEQVAAIHAHSLTHTAAKAATQTAEGNIEYWYCSGCGKYYSNSAATIEITKAQTITPKLPATAAKTYTVRFDARGGVSSHPSREILYGNPYGPLPTASRSGYRFLGWFTSASGGSQVTSGDINSIAGNQTLYAHWEQMATAHTHNLLHTAAKAATQTAEGNIEYWHCLECGTYFSDSSATKEITWAQTKIAKLSTAIQTHTIKFDAGGGSVSESQRTVSVGSDIGKLPVPSRTGYQFLGWYIMPTTSSAEVTSDTPVNQVTLPDGCTLYAQWEPVGTEGKTPVTPSSPPGTPTQGPLMTDISEGAYYYDAVQWALEKGITTGTSSNKFSPDSPCTRAQIVTFLWRAAGSPTSNASNIFTDVTPGTYYYNAVVWAVSRGITAGTGANTFSPDATCTRSQAVTFLHRAEGSPSAKSSAFYDVRSNSFYARAVDWAVSKGITNGTGNNIFSPDDTCTRGQIVTFLYRAS